MKDLLDLVSSEDKAKLAKAALKGGLVRLVFEDPDLQEILKNLLRSILEEEDFVLTVRRWVHKADTYRYQSGSMGDRLIELIKEEQQRLIALGEEAAAEAVQKELRGGKHS